ncbi:ankyrin repeat-containing protein [Apiospora arundinis]
MVEPLGAVASGIAVTQLGVAAGGTVLKLKKLFDQVNDAPETISDLIEHIEMVYPSVWDFERQCSQVALPTMLWDSTRAVESLAYCRRALKRLSDVVDALAAQIASRRGFRQKLVALKVVFKKDELKRLENQLRNSLEVLQFAQGAYIRALLIATPNILITKLLQQPLQLQVPTALETFEDQTSSLPSSCQAGEVSKPRAVSRTKRRNNSRIIKTWYPCSSLGALSIHTDPNDFYLEFKPPLWLAGLASSFSLYMSKYRSEWDVQFRLYSERPNADPVFCTAHDGDIAGLQSMFDQRTASPFDRDEGGWTLLHYTLRPCHVKATKLLTDMGVDLMERDQRGRIGDILVQRFLLGPDWISDPERVCIEAWTKHGVSLLHHITARFTQITRLDESEATRVREFVRDIMRMTTDLQQLTPGSDRYRAFEALHSNITPFIRLMMKLLWWEAQEYLTMPNKSNKIIQAWVEELKKAGISIREYGSREQDILQNILSESRISFEIRTSWWSNTKWPLRGYKVSLYGFTYGPNVEDWAILCSQPTDHFAGEFWDLVEESPLDMPGAWVE